MRSTRIRRAVQMLQEPGARNAAFYLFCVFLVSYFLHLTARVQVLGTLHFDLLLAAATALAIALGGRRTTPGSSARMDPVARRLWILGGYILVTIPFVEWPGSVLHNLETYAKSLCFFFFVVATVDTTKKKKHRDLAYVSRLWSTLPGHSTNGMVTRIYPPRIHSRLATGSILADEPGVVRRPPSAIA